MAAVGNEDVPLKHSRPEMSVTLVLRDCHTQTGVQEPEIAVTTTWQWTEFPQWQREAGETGDACAWCQLE